jgi:hypothetical protein
MSSRIVQKLADVSVGRAEYEQQLLTDDGQMSINNLAPVDKVNTILQDFVEAVSAAGEHCAAVALHSARFCAVLTAAALRTVGALRSIPGSNILVSRSGLQLKDRMVPGFVKMKVGEAFDVSLKHVVDLGKNGPGKKMDLGKNENPTSCPEGWPGGFGETKQLAPNMAQGKWEARTVSCTSLCVRPGRAACSQPVRRLF